MSTRVVSPREMIRLVDEAMKPVELNPKGTEDDKKNAIDHYHRAFEALCVAREHLATLVSEQGAITREFVLSDDLEES